MDGCLSVCLCRQYPWSETQDYMVGHSRMSLLKDERTNELYRHDPALIISIKCLYILLGLPVYTAGTMAWFAGKAIVDLARGAGFAVVREDIWNVVRSPFYGVEVAFAAAIGVFFPFEGRALEATIERDWQRGASPREDCRMLGLGSSTCFYLAWCFQPVGRVGDAHIHLEPAVAN